MADVMYDAFASGINEAPVNSRSNEPVVREWNAHAFFTAFGVPLKKVEHQNFTKNDGKTKLEGYSWAKPFFANIKGVYIGKKLDAEGFHRAQMVQALKDEKTTMIIRIRKGASEAYITRPTDVEVGDAAADFE